MGSADADGEALTPSVEQIHDEEAASFLRLVVVEHRDDARVPAVAVGGSWKS